MTIWIENPFRGFVVGWTWKQHRDAGYAGGTDYVFYSADGHITAAADGRITLAVGQNGFTPGPAIILALADGRSINYREVAKVLVGNGQMVKRGQAIGLATQGGRWPHIDATVGGVRVPFEPLVNIGLDPAGGGGIVITESDDMAKNYHNSNGTVYTLGDSWGKIWTNLTDFSCLANLAQYGAYVEVNLTPDQVTTVVAEANARGTAYSATGGSAPAPAPAIDYAALAKAVNDDAAKRLES